MSQTRATSQTALPRLHFRVPPEPAHLLRARERLRDYLRLYCAEAAVINDVVLCVEEAATNAIKHGGARNIFMSLESENSRLILKIKDDGSGFAPVEAGRTGMGLRVMHYRARMIGATLSVRQRKQGGVIVTCSAPWRRN